MQRDRWNTGQKRNSPTAEQKLLPSDITPLVGGPYETPVPKTRLTDPRCPIFASLLCFGGLSPFWCRQMQIEKVEVQQEKALTPNMLNEIIRASEPIRDVATKVLSMNHYHYAVVSLVLLTLRA